MFQSYIFFLDIFTADSLGRLKIYYNAITYIDFGAHTIYQILGLRSTDDVTKSNYYQAVEDLVLPNKYIPGQSYNVSWKTAMTTCASNVRLTLCSFFIGKTTATVAAIVSKSFYFISKTDCSFFLNITKNISFR